MKKAMYDAKVEASIIEDSYEAMVNSLTKGQTEKTSLHQTFDSAMLMKRNFDRTVIIEKGSRETESITIDNQNERPTTEETTLNPKSIVDFTNGPYNDTLVLPSIVGLIGKHDSQDASS